MSQLITDAAAKIQPEPAGSFIHTTVEARITVFKNPRQIGRRNADARVRNPQRFFCLQGKS